MDLSLERWEQISASEREALARRLESQLPSGFSFQGLQLYRLGELEHPVALYQKERATFALIPGGVVSLGYDAGRDWEPTREELESWQGTAQEYGLSQNLEEHIAEVTLRVRRVELSPFLIETAARELGWEPVSNDEPEVRQILRKYKGHAQVEVCREDGSIRVRRGPGELVLAERSVPRTHAELSAEFQAAGFRFPTGEEWEYACGGGATTLFRWGDHAPCDRYPTDISPAEAAWRRDRVLSGGRAEYPAGGFTSDWDQHRRPNAFGLLIASDPYKCELVAETGITRGGDGGCAICGGAGFFMGWLTLATAYFEEHACKHDLTESIPQGYTIGRRVLELR